MKRVLHYQGIGSTPTSKTNTKSDATIRWSDCFETDTPNDKSVVAVARPYPSDGRDTKDEAFFDSQTWLESDCEDFFSVQGENTPSLMASPVHQKKTLRELLAESFDSRKHIDPKIFTDERPEEEPKNTTSRLRRMKSSGSARHCFPGLVRSLGCSEWKKKSMMPLSPVCIAHY